jgi:hypothetical protein
VLEVEDLVNCDEARNYPRNIPMAKALEFWKKAYPSPPLTKEANKIFECQRFGGHQADLLKPLEAMFLARSDSGPAFYPLIRQQELEIRTPLPERSR